MSAAQAAIAQLANEAIVDLQKENNEAIWYQDKGPGIPKPKRDDESSTEEEDDDETPTNEKKKIDVKL